MPAPVKPADSIRHRSGAFAALDGGGIDKEVETRMSAADDLDDVVEDRSAGGGDDTNRARKGGQGTLAGGVEEALGQEAGLELLERKLQGPGTPGFQGLGDELKLAARLVDGDAAAHQNCEAVLRAEAEKLRLAAEEHNRKLRLAVLQREVNVAGGRGMAVGDLAFDPKIGVGSLDMLSEVVDQGANAPGRGGCAWTRFWVRGARLGGRGMRGLARAPGRGGLRARVRPEFPACHRLQSGSPYRMSLKHRRAQWERSAVEAVGLDIGCDGWREQARAGVSVAQTAAEFSGGDVLVDGGEQMDAGALGEPGRAARADLL